MLTKRWYNSLGWEGEVFNVELIVNLMLHEHTHLLNDIRGALCVDDTLMIGDDTFDDTVNS